MFYCFMSQDDGGNSSVKQTFGHLHNPSSSSTTVNVSSTRILLSEPKEVREGSHVRGYEVTTVGVSSELLPGSIPGS